jgi:hypothetical protein
MARNVRMLPLAMYGPFSLVTSIVLFCHPSRVHGEFVQGSVEPFREYPLDVVAIAADGHFAAALADEMSIQIPLPSLPEGDAAMARSLPPLGVALAPSGCLSLGCRPWLIRATYVFAVARAARVDISPALPMETLIDEARLPPCLRSPWTVNVLFRFPTTTKKPFSSVSRAKYQPSFGVGN